MTIVRLVITDVRNLKDVSLALSPTINLFYGVNGSGKTSLLESVYLLSLGRSFRGNTISPVINHKAKQCTVFAELDHQGQRHPLGLTKDRQGNMQIKYQSQPIKSISELAHLCPLQIINPDSYQLLSGGPSVRRKFMDWGLFHVEPRFFPMWKRYRRSLKQRNILLKQPKTKLQDIQAWDGELSTYGESIASFRQAYIQRLSVVFHDTLTSICELENVTLTYYPGWDDKQRLLSCLQQNYDRDRLLGFSHHGPHRADVRIKYQAKDVVQVLSRGQQKIVTIALLLAQGKVYQTAKNRVCIYLVDDLSSELDQSHRQRVCDYLMDMKSQLFITSIAQKDIMDYFKEYKDLRLFHVEQGQVSSIQI